MKKNERVLTIAAGMLLLSMLLMIIIIPGVYTGTLQNTNNLDAVIGISVVIVIHLIIFIAYISLIKRIRRDGEKGNAAYIVLGILLIILGLIISDGAFAFLDNKNILYVSFLMFTSVFCDIIASILTFIAIFLKPQKNIMKNKIIIGILIGLGTVVMLFMAPIGMFLSLAFWIYLGVLFWKRKRVFHEEIEPQLAKNKLKRLSIVAGISFFIAVVGIVTHNVQSNLLETKESLYFFIGIIASYIFILTSIVSLLIFLKARQKPYNRSY